MALQCCCQEGTACSPTSHMAYAMIGGWKHQCGCDIWTDCLITLARFGTPVWQYRAEGRAEYGFILQNRQPVTKGFIITDSTDAQFPVGSTGGFAMHTPTQICTADSVTQTWLGIDAGYELSYVFTRKITTADALAAALVLLAQLDWANTPVGLANIGHRWQDGSIIEEQTFYESFCGYLPSTTVKTASGVWTRSILRSHAWQAPRATMNPPSASLGRSTSIAVAANIWESKIRLTAAWCEYEGPFAPRSPDACGFVTDSNHVPNCSTRVRTNHPLQEAGTHLFLVGGDLSNRWRTVGCNAANGIDCAG